MRSKYAMYNEETYVSRVQLKNIYPSSIADLIYDEIIEDRSLFRYEISFHQRKYYITLNQTLYKKLLKIYEISGSIHFLKRHQLEDYLHAFVKRYKIEIKNELLLFLCGNDTFLLKIFILKFKVKNEQLLCYFLQIYQKEEWIAYINAIHLYTMEYEEDLDLTYALRHFLDELALCIIRNKKQIDKIKRNDFLTLYPTLTLMEKEFCLHHYKENQHYCIHDYQTYSKKSYEGSRLSMEKLYKVGLYRRVKIGKKHMYIPNNILQD